MVGLPWRRIGVAALALETVLLAGLFFSPWRGSTDSPTAATQVTQIKTVFLIVLENTSWSDIVSNPTSAPYINNTLLPIASRAEQFYNYTPGGSPVRPSEPNYVWLEGGSTVYPDHTFTTNDDPSPSNSTGVTDHLVSLLDTAGFSWKAYQEDIPGTNCPLQAVAGYRPKHNPMVFFRDVTNNNDPNSSYCIQHIRPLTELFTDLASDSTASYNFVTPNQCNAMHDTCTSNRIRQGDDWLSSTIPQIMQSNAYKDGGAIFITWDENAPPRTDSIGMIVLSAFAKGGGYSNSVRYDHSSTLKTMQRIFGLQPLLRNAATATDLSDLFLPGTFSRFVYVPAALRSAQITFP